MFSPVFAGNFHLKTVRIVSKTQITHKIGNKNEKMTLKLGIYSYWILVILIVFQCREILKKCQNFKMFKMSKKYSLKVSILLNQTIFDRHINWFLEKKNHFCGQYDKKGLLNTSETFRIKIASGKINLKFQ